MSAQPSPARRRGGKARRCDWFEGTMTAGFSLIHRCPRGALFLVQEQGVTVARVCAQHSIVVVQHGYQIR